MCILKSKKLKLINCFKLFNYLASLHPIFRLQANIIYIITLGSIRNLSSDFWEYF